MTRKRSLPSRRRPSLLWGAPLLLACLCACGSSDLAGTATETTNGYAALSTGGPATGAQVRLIDAHNWLALANRGATAVIESTMTDGQGKFSLHTRLGAECNLQIDTKQEGLLLRSVDTLMRIPGDTLALALHPYATVHGTIDSSAASSVRVVLFGGSTYRAAVVQGNSFAISTIPEGALPLVTQSTGSESGGLALAGVLTVPAGGDLDAGILTADAAVIPVEDFSQGWDRTNLGRVLGGGRWFTSCDTSSPLNGSSSVQTRIVSGGDAYSGSSLKATICLGSGYTSPFAGFGFHIGDANALYNCSTLKKIAFMARGSGLIRVSVKTGLNYEAGTLITIPQAWTKIEIPVDSLRSSDGYSSVSWTGIDRVEFNVLGQFGTVGDTVAISLDDIEFEGMRLQALVP